MDEKQFKELMQTLNVIVHLQTATLTKDKSAKESIKLMLRAGIPQTKIAQILGKNAHYINKEVSLMRKKGELSE